MNDEEFQAQWHRPDAPRHLTTLVLTEDLKKLQTECDEWQQIAAANGLAGLEAARELDKARAALRAIKLEAVSLADAQVIALEALVVMEAKL